MENFHPPISYSNCCRGFPCETIFITIFINENYCLSTGGRRLIRQEDEDVLELEIAFDFVGKFVEQMEGNFNSLNIN